MELKYYTTQELKEELKRRAELAREKRAEEMKICSILCDNITRNIYRLDNTQKRR